MKQFWNAFKRNRGAVIGLSILIAMVLFSIIAPLLFPKSPWAIVQRPFIPPLTRDGFPLGTDTLGRT